MKGLLKSKFIDFNFEVDYNNFMKEVIDDEM